MSTSTKAPKTNLSPYVWHAQSLQTATKSLNSRWFKAENLADDLITTIISTDTRSIEQGDIFLALSGDNFDGHDYAQMAVDKGAIALIVEKELAIDIPQLIVSDSRLALGQLGAYRRAEHPNLKVIAITGSSGKTTVKEMLGSIFAHLPNQPNTLVTRGNLNNDLGVPMMLLELSDEHEFAILELGANHIGEIAYTTELVKPDVACILNIGTAHLGEFGGRDKIAEAKSEIYQGLNDNNVAVYPKNDEYAQQLKAVAETFTSNIVSFGMADGDDTDVTADDVQINAFESEFLIKVASYLTTSKRKKVGEVDGEGKQSTYPVKLPLAGEHNVSNALAVTACALSLGVAMDDIVKGLEKAQPPKGRLYSQMVGNHRLVDDAYNANPHSMRASASVVASQEGLKVMVLGDIGELGDVAKSEHFNLGADIGKMQDNAGVVGIDRIYAVGEFAQDLVDGFKSMNSKGQASAYNNKDDLFNDLLAFINEHKEKHATILFKGSRFMAMETIYNKLVEDLHQTLS